MEKIIAFVLSLFIYLNGFGQFDSLYVSHHYSYSESDGEPYGLKSRTEIHFDSVGHVVSQQNDVFNGYQFEHKSISLFTYNSAGLNTEYLIKNYEGNYWKNFYRTAYYFNANNQPDSILSQYWQTPTSSWNTSSATYYSYNQNFHLIFKSENGTRYYYYPDANDKDTLSIKQNIISNVWTDVSKTQIYYDSFGRKIYEIASNSPSTGIWAFQDSTTFSYYPNDSVFVTKKYLLTDTPASVLSIDSIVYDADTLFVYLTYFSQPNSQQEWRRVTFDDGTGYNYYESPHETFDGTQWSVSDYTSSTYDSLTRRQHFQSLIMGSYSESDLYFDLDGHMISSAGNATAHSGYYSYSNSYYYYYLTNGITGICPGITDSLWVLPAMNSYSWTTGGTNSVKQINSEGQYYCMLVNQFGHSFYSEPHFVHRTLSPTAPRSVDSSITVCYSSQFRLNAPEIPVYDYQWLRNDTVLPGAVSSILRFNAYNGITGFDGDYKLVVSTGCGSDTSSITHIHFSQPGVRINPAGTAYLCEHDTLIQLADSGFISYVWEQGETTAMAKSYAGHLNTFVTATDSIGCSSYYGVNVSLSNGSSDLPLQFYQPYDSVLRSLNFTLGIFQWYLNGDTIIGATSFQYVVDQSGDYKFSYNNGMCIYESEEKNITYPIFKIVFNVDTMNLCQNQVYPYVPNFFQVKGGIPPFHYQWFPSTGLSNDTISNPSLTAILSTKYSLTITDSTGTVASDSMYIWVSNPVPVTLTASKDSLCAVLLSDGYDTLRVTDAGYGSYLWMKDGQALNTQGTNLEKYTLNPGAYWVIFNNGCVTRTDTLVLAKRAPLPSASIRLQSTPTDWCQTDSVVLILDIPEPEKYTYQWRDVQAQQVLPSSIDTVVGYSGGQYYLFLTDSNSCHKDYSFNVEAILPDSIVPFNLNLTGVIPACYGDSITLSATVYPDWNYQWLNYENDLLNNNPDYTTVYSGYYQVKVDNGFGCHGEDQVYLSFGNYLTLVSLTYNGNQLFASSNNNINSWNWFLNDTLIPGVNQNHYQPQSPGWYKVFPSNSYTCGTLVDSVFIACALATSVTDASCYLACDGSISVLAQGAGPFSLLWLNGDTTNQQLNLCKGTYLVQMTDSNSCTATDSVVVKEPFPLNIGYNITAPSCFQSCDGEILATITGGTSPYTYYWSTGDTTSFLNSLCAGTYTFIANDFHSCSTSASINLISPQPLSIQATVHNASCQSCNDGSIVLNTSGGTGMLHLLWSTGDTTNSLSSLIPGAYSICLSDANSCVQCDTISVGFSVSVQNITSDAVKIFPNPANQFSMITLPLSSLDKNLQLSLLNNLGQEIILAEIQDDKIRIPTNKFTEGVYYIEIKDREGSIVTRNKIVVIH